MSNPNTIAIFCFDAKVGNKINKLGMSCDKLSIS